MNFEEAKKSQRLVRRPCWPKGIGYTISSCDTYAFGQNETDKRLLMTEDEEAEDWCRYVPKESAGVDYEQFELRTRAALAVEKKTGMTFEAAKESGRLICRPDWTVTNKYYNPKEDCCYFSSPNTDIPFASSRHRLTAKEKAAEDWCYYSPDKGPRPLDRLGSACKGLCLRPTNEQSLPCSVGEYIQPEDCQYHLGSPQQIEPPVCGNRCHRPASAEHYACRPSLRGSCRYYYNSDDHQAPPCGEHCHMTPWNPYSSHCIGSMATKANCTYYTKSDPIDHPSYYNQSDYEVIDIIEAYKLDFHLGNVIKYVLRAEFKGNKEQDLQKAQWYLNRYLEKKAWKP